jgi:hypothetical protein
MQGILVTTPLNREKMCTREMSILLNEVSFPTQFPSIIIPYKFILFLISCCTKLILNLKKKYADATIGEEIRTTKAEEDSIEDAFNAELAALNGSSTEKRFWGVDIGIDCCLFIKVLLHNILYTLILYDRASRLTLASAQRSEKTFL